MKNLQEATERICDLKGSILALDALLMALIDGMTPAAREEVRQRYERHAEVARTVMLNTASEHTLHAFERDVRSSCKLLSAT